MAMFGKRKRFWDAAPLPGSRSAVVVGGGIHGLSAAYFLAEAWKLREVAVLEAGSIGRMDFGGNDGVVRADQRTAEEVAFHKEGLELWPRLTDRLRIGPLFDPCGTLTLAHDPAGIAELRFRAIVGRLTGVDTLLIDPLACRELVPALDVTDRPRRPAVGGLLHVPGGRVRIEAAILGMARAAARRGVTLHEGVRALRIETADGRVVAVETDRGTIQTPRLLVAAGFGSAALLRTAGVELSLRRLRRTSMVSARLRPTLNLALSTLDGTATPDRHVVQTPSGEIEVGTSPTPVPSPESDMESDMEFDSEFDPEFGAEPAGEFGSKSRAVPNPAREMETLAAGLVELLPCMAGVPFVRFRVREMDGTADGMPVADGNFGIDGLFADCGWADAEFQSGPAAGKFLAEFMATGRRPDILRPFALSRPRDRR